MLGHDSVDAAGELACRFTHVLHQFLDLHKLEDHDLDRVVVEVDSHLRDLLHVLRLLVLGLFEFPGTKAPHQLAILNFWVDRDKLALSEDVSLLSYLLFGLLIFLLNLVALLDQTTSAQFGLVLHH